MQDSGQDHAPDALSPEKNSGTHRMWDWVDPRADMGVLVKIKISFHQLDCNQGPPGP
jgi:hypothetical protein